MSPEIHGENLRIKAFVTAVAILVGAGAIAACSGVEAQGGPGTTGGSAPSGTEAPGSSMADSTVAGIPGDVAPGDDKTIQQENANGEFECGAPKGEKWEDKAFSSDRGLTPHNNAHPDLAKGTRNLWNGVMGEEGFVFLANESMNNNEATAEVTVEDDAYRKFIEKQVATPVQEDAVGLNHRCLLPDGTYGVAPAGYKHLQKDATTLTGLVLADDKYDDGNRDNNNDFVDKTTQGARDKLFIQRVDTDGDGINDATHIGVKFRDCGNDVLRTPITPPGVELPPEESTPNTTPGINTTVTTRGTTTTLPPSTVTTVNGKTATTVGQGGATTLVGTPPSSSEHQATTSLTPTTKEAVPPIREGPSTTKKPTSTPEPGR